METAQDARVGLDAVGTVEDLEMWAQDLYDSGLLDESEQVMTDDPDYGPLAPWHYPDDADVLKDDGENVIVYWQDSEGEHQYAQWDNSKRQWLRKDPLTTTVPLPVAVVTIKDNRMEHVCYLPDYYGSIWSALYAVQSERYEVPTMALLYGKTVTTDTYEPARGYVHVVVVEEVPE